MFWNIVLAVLAGLSQAVNSWMGYKVTGKNLNPRQERLYDFIFVACGVVGIVAVGMIAYRSGKQERAHLAIRLWPTYEYNASADPSFLPIGQPLAMNVSYKNVGSGSAFNLATAAYALLEADESKPSQVRAITQFEEWNKTMPSLPSGTLAKDVEHFFTARGQRVSPEDVANLVAGRRVVYIVGLIAFKDDYGDRVQPFCQFLQTPQVGGALIWGLCSNYNEER
jgi:hypothetical protein